MEKFKYIPSIDELTKAREFVDSIDETFALNDLKLHDKVKFIPNDLQQKYRDSYSILFKATSIAEKIDRIPELDRLHIN